MIHMILKSVEIILLIWMGLSTIYILFFSFAGHFHHPESSALRQQLNRFAVLIPAYREDIVIVDTVSRALLQVYPKELFDVIVIADSLREDTVRKLEQTGITLIRVGFDKSTKAKSLQKALECIGPDYDVALILDADNIMEPGALEKINNSINLGYMAVQCHRVSKNQNTPLAILDSISEEINNHIFRKGHRNISLSSALIGSGMAFDYSLFRKYIYVITAVGGFDKELEIRLIRDEIKIGYLHGCLVADEKIQDSGSFTKQRRRWIGAQVRFFSIFAGSAFSQLFKNGQVDYFDKVFQMGLPPRILQIGTTGLFTLYYHTIAAFSIVPELVKPESILWSVMFILTLLALLISVPSVFYNRSTLRALFYIPKGFLLMLFSAITIKGANKEFIHTTHKIVY